MQFLESIYYYANTLHRKLSKPKSIQNTYIISIGNLTVGGTGKTPTTIYISNILSSLQYSHAILTRGYKSKASKKGEILLNSNLSIQNLSNQNFSIKHSSKKFGDEPMLISSLIPNIPIGIGKNRIQMALNIYKQYKTRIFILDDGFQTYKMYRNLDIVLIDATNPFGNFYTLPRGILREPMEELKRADILIITKSNLVSNEKYNGIQKMIKNYAPGKPIFSANYLPVGYFDVKEQLYPTDSITPLTHLHQLNVWAISAIANPASFYKTLTESCKLTITNKIEFADHETYTISKLKNIIKQLQKEKNKPILVTTEKDWIKIREFDFFLKKFPYKFIVLKMDLQVNDNDSLVFTLKEKLQSNYK